MFTNPCKTYSIFNFQLYRDARGDSYIMQLQNRMMYKVSCHDYEIGIIEQQCSVIILINIFAILASIIFYETNYTQTVYNTMHSNNPQKYALPRV